MDAIIDFLRDGVMGRTLYTDELTYSLEDGALEGVYADRMTFANLLRSDTSLRFDLFVQSRERIYETANGERRRLRKDFSGASHFHYELARRRSTGRVTGFMRYVSSTLPAAPAEAMASGVWDLQLRDGELIWREKEMIYRDQPGPEGAHRPVAFEAACRLFAEDGKARYEYRGACFDVEPDTLARTPSRSVFPAFLAKER